MARSPDTIQTRVIRSGSVLLSMADCGQHNSTCLLFLHGFPERKESWRSCLHAFGDRYHCVAVDNRGFGDSDRPQVVADYAMSQILEDIRAVITTVGKPTILIGHDWGGIAAWYFAAHFPQMLQQVVVLNAPHPVLFQVALFSNNQQREASQYINRFRDPECEARLVALGIETFWKMLFGTHLADGSITIKDKRSQLQQWSQPGALTAMLNWYRASPVVVPTPEQLNCQPPPVNLPIISIPVTVIWGMQDKLLLPLLLDGLERHVQNFIVNKIDGAGHGLLYEASAEVIGYIEQALKRNAIT
jgi:pimeloyl-ACP methyl ester carboxylesterase